MKKYLITLVNESDNRISTLQEINSDNFNLQQLKSHPKFNLLRLIEQNELESIQSGNQFYYLDNNIIKIGESIDTETYLKERQLQQSIKNIDKEIQNKILEGFTFKDNLFSLSQNAQINWQGLLGLYNSNVFGESQIISTKDNKTFILKKEDLLEFILTGKQAILDAMNYGYNEKSKLL